MPTNPSGEQADETDAGVALALLANPILDPLFPTGPKRHRERLACPCAFAQWLVASTRPALIVELGTHNGISYAAFCETVLQEKMPTRCYAVDSWAGDDHAGHYDESVYTQLRAFHDGRYGAFSELLRMTFDEARHVIADGAVDLLHIDGFHSYDAVRHDFEGWAQKLSPRAVVLFHDTNVLGRGFGVARFWAEVEGRFPSFSFLHGHGLGVLAVGPDAPPAIGRLCATAPSDAAVLRERFAALGRLHALDYAQRETVRQKQRLQREAAERDGVVDSLRRSLDEVLRHRDSLLEAQALAEQRLPAQEATIASLRRALHETEVSLDGARAHAAQVEAAARDQAARMEAAALDQAARLEAALDQACRLNAALDRADQLEAAALDQATRLEATVRDRERQIDERDRSIGDLRFQATEDKAQLSHLRAEIEALWGNLTAARADAQAAHEDGRAEAARLQAEVDRRDHDLAALRAAELETIVPRAGPGSRPRRH